MSMGIIKNGEYQKCAGMTQSGELVMGASTIRKGNFVIGWSSDADIHYVKQNVTFAEPMPDADYEVSFTYTDVSNWAELMNIKVCEKTVNGFNILCSYTDYKYNGTITWTAFKLFTVEGLENVENDVAALKAKDVVQTAAITLGSNFTGTVSCVKRNGIVTLTFFSVTAVSATGSSTLFTLPNGFRPNGACFITLWANDDNMRIVNIQSSGAVDVGGAGTASWFDPTDSHAYNIWGTISFVAAN